MLLLLKIHSIQEQQQERQKQEEQSHSEHAYTWRHYGVWPLLRFGKRTRCETGVIVYFPK